MEANQTQELVSNTNIEAKNEIKEQFSDVLGILSSFRSQITMLQNKLRGLEKNVNRKMKVMQREAKKNRNKGNRKPSGFAVPTKISDDLCLFMGKPKGTKVARTEVTQYIIEYIRQHNLQKDGNRKYIKPNMALKSLLAVEANEEVTYFNLQRYMNRHFVKGA
tara:strand:- start:1107 stop:1595 length:489 start_codon:yes stop_codon:yes gene_type:complete